MNARPGATLWRIRVPAALPAMASGLRVAAAVAPIGAVIGEWVGSSAGLGYLMLHANARMQVDLMFAALLILAAMALALYAAVDGLTPAAGPLATRAPLGEKSTLPVTRLACALLAALLLWPVPQARAGRQVPRSCSTGSSTPTTGRS